LLAAVPVMVSAARETAFFRTREGENWTDDTFAYDSAVSALNLMLDAGRPTGDPRIDELALSDAILSKTAMPKPGLSGADNGAVHQRRKNPRCFQRRCS
jgi:hypothetical protein